MVMEACTFIGGQLQHHTLVVSEMDGDYFVAQAFTFLVAGFETSGSTLSYALYELALHPEIQHRVRTEIMRVLNKHDGQVTYDGIQEMAYLDIVVSGEGIEAVYIRFFEYATRKAICPPTY
jgi:hypothetical protein